MSAYMSASTSDLTLLALVPLALQSKGVIIIRFFFALGAAWRYNVQVPTARTCVVSFTDSENIRHSVEVTASTLYEAAVLTIAEFRSCGFTGNAPGPATRLTVKVQAPATSHEVQWGKIEAWLQGVGKPNGQGLKGRLRDLLRG